MSHYESIPSNRGHNQGYSTPKREADRKSMKVPDFRNFFRVLFFRICLTLLDSSDFLALSLATELPLWPGLKGEFSGDHHPFFYPQLVISFMGGLSCLLCGIRQANLHHLGLKNGAEPPWVVVVGDGAVGGSCRNSGCLAVACCRSRCLIAMIQFLFGTKCLNLFGIYFWSCLWYLACIDPRAE